MAVTITLLQLVLKRVTALAPKSLLPSWGATALSPRPRPEQDQNTKIVHRSKPNQSCFSVMFKRVLLLMIVAMVMMGMIMMMIVTLLVSMMTDDVLLITSSISIAIIITCCQAPLTANPRNASSQAPIAATGPTSSGTAGVGVQGSGLSSWDLEFPAWCVRLR